MNESAFCSVLSKQRDDYLPGSASTYNKLLLVEYDQPWTHKAFIDSNINPLVKKYISDFTHLNKVKLFLVKNAESNKSNIRIFAFNLDQDKNFQHSIILSNYEEMLSVNLGSLFENNTQPANEIFYLVCTNGKKDKCCSKFGLPVYRELVKRNKNVWQCTHVGGDRFAPNIIVLPQSLYFGHIMINEIPDFISATENRSIYYTRYRGRSIYRNYEQAAEYFLLRFLNNFSTSAFKLTSSEKITENISAVVFCNQADNCLYRVDVERGLSTEKNFLTCTAIIPNHVPFFKLRSIQQIA